MAHPNESPHLGFMLLHGVRQDIIIDGIQEVVNDKINIIIEEDSAPFVGAAIEWAIPAAVGIYIFKSYFDGFLKEAGKEHYHLLKKGIRKIIHSVYKYVIPHIKLIGTKGKIDKKIYTTALSISSVSSNGKNYKLIFLDGKDEEYYLIASEKFLDMLEKEYSGNITHIDMKEIYGVIYFIYNEEKNDVMPFNPKKNHS